MSRYPTAAAPTFLAAVIAFSPNVAGYAAEVKELATQDWTMVIVTHEIRFAQQVADQVLFLDEGVIVERGPADQVIGAPREERTRRFLQRVLEHGRPARTRTRFTRTGDVRYAARPGRR